MPQTPTAQAQVITTALEEVTNSEPFLPFPGSVLPALLALRKTHRVTQQSKELLVTQSAEAEKATRGREVDRAALRDQKLLKDALEARIQALRADLQSRSDMQPEDGMRERLGELEKRKKRYKKETLELMKSLNNFFDAHLAAMLAAEELGGPVVGDLMDIDPEDLGAGFSAQGKLKKPKEDVNQDKRQRRIDEIWGNKNAEDEHGQEGGAERTDEVVLAGKEMRELTEELLNKLAEARGNNADSYVQLSRESAAARFLIRSKVAQFHPKDATRLRLIDFGRELEE